MSEEKFEYFIGQTNERLKAMDKKLDELVADKNKRAGIMVVVSAIFAGAWTVLIELFKKS